MPTAAVNGIDVHYDVIGEDGPGRPLVLTHGFAHGSRWRNETFRAEIEASWRTSRRAALWPASGGCRRHSTLILRLSKDSLQAWALRIVAGRIAESGSSSETATRLIRSGREQRSLRPSKKRFRLRGTTLSSVLVEGKQM